MYKKKLINVDAYRGKSVTDARKMDWNIGTTINMRC